MLNILGLQSASFWILNRSPLYWAHVHVVGFFGSLVHCVVVCNNCHIMIFFLHVRGIECPFQFKVACKIWPLLKLLAKNYSGACLPVLAKFLQVLTCSYSLVFCIFLSAQCSQEKFHNCLCWQKKTTACVLANACNDHSISLIFNLKTFKLCGLRLYHSWTIFNILVVFVVFTYWFFLSWFLFIFVSTCTEWYQWMTLSLYAFHSHAWM